MKKIRWGILSTGRIANQFAADFCAVRGASVHAVAGRQLAAAEQFAHRHQIPNAYQGYEALFSDPNIHAIYIGSPHSLHFEHAKRALEAGKAVLCEKPLTINFDECSRLQKIAADNNAYLMEAMWTYFLPAIKKALAWVADGRIGKIKHIKADFGYPQRPYDASRREYDKSLAGGCLLEMGVYPVAIAWLFLRQDPESIQVSSRLAPNGVEDDLSWIAKYRDCTATLGTSFRCKLQNWAYIIGDEGYIAIPDFWRARECSFYVLDERVERFIDNRQTQGLCFEAQAVTDDLLQKKTSPSQVTAEDSLAFARHMDWIRAQF
ncbi:Gfo/Idh/MocA family protein [Gilvimarinus algae]|uniref:Gfo/Idh/MocA family oxidoreductase n=1 Tax=Gilvimarinus algae TaxID=3058037 RepID=A0ABT8TB20_9GAMM|nr:Gfo/Idh/MocA family oxidoreductase [Gilvimarinus sp. SDUM040014]MDO3381320.1 Gfo/Idh/MocA family oxidoreductase [Gilvimarinus sp. SDUM040014]